MAEASCSLSGRTVLQTFSLNAISTPASSGDAFFRWATSPAMLHPHLLRRPRPYTPPARWPSHHLLFQRKQVFSSDGAGGHGRLAVVAAVSTSEVGTESRSGASVGPTSKRVLVIGGTGRVGGSTAAALARRSVKVVDAEDEGEAAAMAVVVAGRSRERAQRVLSSVPTAEFIECDIRDKASVVAAVQGMDLVVHTAGPFQRATDHPWAMNVLEACIESKTPYMDVCDDSSYAQRAKEYHQAACQAGVPCITTTGVYPGVSNLMAAELVREAGKGDTTAERIRFSYFTAGSGGAGPTILETSFLLMGEDVVAYKKGEAVRLKPYSGGTSVDFGKGVGKRPVYLLHLPEVESVHRNLGVPSVSARFGTAPFFWNWAMIAVGLLPRSLLNDRSRVASLAALSDPLVRKVDERVGETMAMRVDLDASDGVRAASLYSHKRLSDCVGTSTAAFAQAVLEGASQPGVWYPEEEGGVAVAARGRLLERASEGCIQFVTNKSPWMIERPPKNLGFGLYI